MDTYDYTIAKLSKNAELVNKIEEDYNITQASNLEHSKINGIIKPDSAKQINLLNQNIKELMNNYTKEAFAEYANEYKSILNTYSNIYEKLFIQKHKIIYIDDVVPQKKEYNTYILKAFNKSKLYNKIIKPFITGGLLMADFLDISDTYIVDDDFLYKKLTEIKSMYSITESLIHDIIFAIMLIVNIRMFNNIIQNTLVDYTSNGIIFYADPNNINEGFLAYKIKDKYLTLIVNFIIKNISIINKIVTENIPKEILPKILV